MARDRRDCRRSEGEEIAGASPIAPRAWRREADAVATVEQDPRRHRVGKDRARADLNTSSQPRECGKPIQADAGVQPLSKRGYTQHRREADDGGRQVESVDGGEEGRAEQAGGRGRRKLEVAATSRQ